MLGCNICFYVILVINNVKSSLTSNYIDNSVIFKSQKTFNFEGSFLTLTEKGKYDGNISYHVQH